MTDALSRPVVFALVGLASLAWVGTAMAAPASFKVPLTGAQQVPPIKTAGKGTADLTWNPNTRVVARTSPTAACRPRSPWRISATARRARMDPS